MKRFLLSLHACEKFNAQIEGFIAQSENLSLKLEIYRSNPTFYRSNLSHFLVNLVNQHAQSTLPQKYPPSDSERG